jgi:hypothetical protein
MKKHVRMPKDFIKTGAVRQVAWCWSDQAEFAFIKEGRYEAEDLERLSEWCLDAAAYLRQGVPDDDFVKREKAAKLK